MPTFPAFDFSDLDLRKVSFPDVKLPDLKLGDVKLPDFKLGDVKLPDVKLPEVDLPEVDTDRLLGVARDAAYVGIGLTVLAVQQTQVRRRELQRFVTDQVRARRAA